MKKLAHQDGKFLNGAIASIAAVVCEQEAWNVFQTREEPGYWWKKKNVKDPNQSLKNLVHQDCAHHGMLGLGQGAVSVVVVVPRKEVLSAVIQAVNQALNVLVQSHQILSLAIVSVTLTDTKRSLLQRDGKNSVN